MKKLLFLFLSVSIMTFACKNSGENQNDGDSTIVEDNSSDSEDSNSGDRIYKIKKAHIEYEMDMMGTRASINMYFKEYGKTECVEAEMELMGMKSVNRTLELDGFVYNLNMEQKTGSKSDMSKTEEEFNPNDFDFENIPKDLKEKYKIEEIGNEEVAGKTCKVYKFIVDGQDAKFYIWKNIPVKYEISQNNMVLVMKAIKIDENPSFPDGIFEVPSDFEITEM